MIVNQSIGKCITMVWFKIAGTPANKQLIYCSFALSHPCVVFLTVLVYEVLFYCFLLIFFVIFMCTAYVFYIRLQTNLVDKAYFSINNTLLYAVSVTTWTLVPSVCLGGVIAKRYIAISTRNILWVLYLDGYKRPRGRLNKKDGLTRYGNSHVKDKTS